VRHKMFRTCLLPLALGGLLVGPAWGKEPLPPQAAQLANQAAANATAGDRVSPAKVIPVPTEDVSPQLQALIEAPYPLSLNADPKTPEECQANNFLKTMRGLFAWAVEAEHVQADPVAGVKDIKVKSAGFRAWEESDVERFLEYWTPGTREHLALTILLYTGLRRGDVVRLGRQHVKGGMIRIVT
jgi:integrase